MLGTPSAEVCAMGSWRGRVKRTALLVAGLFAAIGLWGCAGGRQGEDSSSISESSPSSADAETSSMDTELPFPDRPVGPHRIVLGAYTDLSGPAAIWGVAGRNGAQMRFDDANEAGGIHGRTIEYIVEDTQYQTLNAIRAANKLINSDKIFAMVLALGTPMNHAIMPIQFEAGVPNIFPFSGSRSMAEPFHKLAFTQRGIHYEEIRAAVKHFVETKGRKSPCVVHQDTDYGYEILEAAEDQAKKMGLELAATSAHKKTETEFIAAILKLKNAGCDLVLFGTIFHDTLLILDSAKKMGWTDVDFVGNDAAYGQAIANAESGAGEGYYAFVHVNRIYLTGNLTKQVRAWYQQYLIKYGAEPNAASMEGWRAADLVVLALERVGPDLSRDKFITALESITNYTDIWGNHLAFGTNDHKGVSDSSLAQIQNKRWVLVGKSITFE